MISFRHHIVTLVAVFLALAVGVVLGAGPLVDVPGAGAEDGDATSARTGDAADGDRYADQLAAETAPRVLDGVLADTPVALVRMPGVPDETVGGLRASVESAGGSVAGVVELTPTLVAASEKSLVDTLGSQLREQVGGAGVDADAPTYERFAQLLARAVATDGSGSADSDDTGASILESLAGGDLLAVRQDPEPRAPVVVLVTGQPSGEEAADDAIWAQLAQGLSAGSSGTVVAGPGQGEAPEALRRLHEEAGDVSTVTGVDGAAGQVTTLLALDRVREGGEVGAFGAAGPDGAVPLG